jgi:hypothetical protein
MSNLNLDRHRRLRSQADSSWSARVFAVYPNFFVAIAPIVKDLRFDCSSLKQARSATSALRHNRMPPAAISASQLRRCGDSVSALAIRTKFADDQTRA